MSRFSGFVRILKRGASWECSGFSKIEQVQNALEQRPDVLVIGVGDKRNTSENGRNTVKPPAYTSFTITAEAVACCLLHPGHQIKKNNCRRKALTKRKPDRHERAN